jgi:hypothetical protein
MSKRRVVPQEDDPRIRTAVEFETGLRSVLEMFHGLPAAKVGHRKARSLKLIHGVVAHCNTVSSAALVLLAQEADHTAAVAPLARIALEHGMTAQWIAIHPHGYDEFIKQGSFKSGKFHKLAGDVGAQIPVEIRDYWASREAPRASKPLQQVRDMFRDLDESEWSYIEYAHLCALVHPSASAVVQYLDIRVDPPVLLHRPEIDRRALLFTLARSVLMANAVYFDLLHGKPMKSAITKVSEDLHLPLWCTKDGKPPRHPQ